jgi:uncharacterized integral membrane protein
MKLKVILVMVLIVLFTIFVTQNTEIVEIQVYFWKIQMSRIVLISISVLIGLLVSGLFGSGKKDAGIYENHNEENDE